MTTSMATSAVTRRRRAIEGRRAWRCAVPVLVLVILTAVAACTPATTLRGLDISPNTLDGQVADGDAQTAGVMPTLAGAGTTIYAVSMNAGVWQSVNGGPWSQLSNSSAYAYSIAIDPTNPHHVAVGDRDGDRADPSKNTSGVHESYDDGRTFPDYFDPRSLGGCPSQAIPSLAFTASGVLVAATACGVAVKTSKAGPWTRPATAIGRNLVTAVTASKTKIWARDAQGTLAVSSADGQHWMPATVKPLPAGISFAHSGDRFTLAAFDDYAFMSTLGQDNGKQNNFNQLLTYDVRNDRWVVQTRIFDPADNVSNDPNFGSLNGTGGCECDGRRFVRAYLSAQGQRHVVFGTGQDVFMSTAQDPQTDMLSWTRIASDAIYSTPPTDPKFRPQLHSDIWDVLVSADGATLWLSNDGGVFKNSQDGKGWLTDNDGLHTQHVHMLYAAPLNTAYAYPTTDNAAWYAGLSGNWKHDSTGDSNFVVGDEGASPLYAFVERQPGFDTLTGFDQAVPDLDQSGTTTEVTGIVKSVDTTFDGPLTFNFIQTLYSGDRADRPADAVMLTKMPLQYRDNLNRPVTVLDDPGQAVAIVRNPTWVNHPDINESRGAGWQLMADNLPPDTTGFLVAGGHNKATLYALAGNPLALFRWDGKVHGSWTQLPIQGPGQPSLLLAGSPKGPVFVNPYRASELYALTATGVRSSTDSGDHWTAETALTAALTGNGAYPLTGTFSPNSSNVYQASHGVGLGTLSDMAFDEVYPDHVVAASPFTGVFFNSGNGTWHDLDAALPKPLTPASSVSVFGNVANVGLEGRSIWQIQGLTMFWQ